MALQPQNVTSPSSDWFGNVMGAMDDMQEPSATTAPTPDAFVGPPDPNATPLPPNPVDVNIMELDTLPARIENAERNAALAQQAGNREQAQLLMQEGVRLRGEHRNRSLNSIENAVPRQRDTGRYGEEYKPLPGEIWHSTAPGYDQRITASVNGEKYLIGPSGRLVMKMSDRDVVMIMAADEARSGDFRKNEAISIQNELLTQQGTILQNEMEGNISANTVYMNSLYRAAEAMPSSVQAQMLAQLVALENLTHLPTDEFLKRVEASNLVLTHGSADDASRLASDHKATGHSSKLSLHDENMVLMDERMALHTKDLESVRSQIDQANKDLQAIRMAQKDTTVTEMTAQPGKKTTEEWGSQRTTGGDSDAALLAAIMESMRLSSGGQPPPQTVQPAAQQGIDIDKDDPTFVRDDPTFVRQVSEEAAQGLQATKQTLTRSTLYGAERALQENIIKLQEKEKKISRRQKALLDEKNMERSKRNARVSPHPSVRSIDELLESSLYREEMMSSSGPMASIIDVVSRLHGYDEGIKDSELDILIADPAQLESLIVACQNYAKYSAGWEDGSGDDPTEWFRVILGHVTEGQGVEMVSGLVEQHMKDGVEKLLTQQQMLAAQASQQAAQQPTQPAPQGVDLLSRPAPAGVTPDEVDDTGGDVTQEPDEPTRSQYTQTRTQQEKITRVVSAMGPMPPKAGSQEHTEWVRRLEILLVDAGIPKDNATTLINMAAAGVDIKSVIEQAP